MGLKFDRPVEKHGVTSRRDTSPLINLRDNLENFGVGDSELEQKQVSKCFAKAELHLCCQVLIARGMLPSRGCSSDECPTVMTIYCCGHEPALGTRPLPGLSNTEFTFAWVEVGNPPALLTRSCAPFAQRAWLAVRDQIPDCTTAGSLGAASSGSAAVSCLFFYVASLFCCQRGVQPCGIEPPQSLRPGPGVMLCLPRPAVNSTDLIFPS
ncbi:uncharacterized protein ACIBXB_018609 isoform 1-T1 [Morphnus guianensis]